MNMFFKPAPKEEAKIALVDELSPLVGELESGSLAGVITTDLFSQAILQYSSIANALSLEKPTYYLEPTNGFSMQLLDKFGGKGEVLLGKIYTLDELLGALEVVEDDSFVFVSNFGILEGLEKGKLIDLRRLVDRKGLYTVISHNTLEINELNLNAEFRRFFLTPEIFEYLMVLRTSSYRGHHRLNLSLLKTPPLFLKNIGEHSIPIDSKAKLLF